MYKVDIINNLGQLAYSLLTIKNVEITALDKIPNISMVKQVTQYHEQNLKGREILTRWKKIKEGERMKHEERWSEIKQKQMNTNQDEEVQEVNKGWRPYEKM